MVTGLHKSTEKNLNPMSATWTKAGKVRRAFKAGRQRQKDLRYDSERAILEARILLIEIRRAMLEAEIFKYGEDVRAALVLMTPDDAKADTVYILQMPRKLEDLPELSAKVAKHEKAEKAVPLGVAIWQRDREANHSDVWIQPWLVNPRAALAAIAARKAFIESEGRETKSTF
jgi:hypothetical protein